MESFVTKQADLFKRIKLTVENMKKMGAAKITKGVITSRLELLERNWTSFSENHNEILDAYSKTGSESPYFKQDYMGTCEEAYVQQKAILLDLLEDVPAGKAVPTQLNATPRSLPKIDLPKFSGDYSCWANFRDLFQSLVIENHSLSNVEKLHYLKTCLTDEPELLIQNIPVTDDNFKRAWAVLTEHYQNLRVLINSHLTNLMSHSSMKKESARELKNLMNRTTDAVQALEALKRPVQYWDDWLVFITTEKLDQKTRMAWETSFESTAEPPTFDQLRTFMTSRSRALEAVERPTGSSTTPTGPSNTLKQEKKQPINSNLRFKAHATHTAGEGNRRCSICNKEHFLLFCPTYKGMNPRERKQIVIDKRLCYNCLAPHSSANCKSTKRCELCVGKHHTSLHHACEQPTAARNSFPPQVPESNTNASENLQLERVSDVTERSTHCAMTSCSAISSVSVVLATAELMVESDRGDKIIVRALIDPCSEVSLIEESMAQLLNLRRVPEKIPVIGVGKTQTYTKGRVSVRIMFRLNKSISYNLNAYVLPRLSSYQTAKSSCSASLAYLEGLTLADPNFLSSRRINLILGADIYAQIITAGLKHGPPNTPVAQATTLGWILTGPLRQSENSDTQTNSAISLQCLMRESELVETLTRFWKLEEVPSTSNQLTEEETICEDHFSKTHKRDKSGRYVVRLPFKSSPKKLGESRGAACTLLAKLERRFRLNVDLQTAYREFLKEYDDLGHMERIPEPIPTPGSTYYLPHHGVMRESSTTTKLRVVFNASFKTSSGVSLNDLVHKGPNLLPEIFSLLLRWRKHAIVFSADVEKMYRQIRVAGEDCDFQRIVWRDTPDESLKTYKLTTVTYGMACAPYLAIRTLHQLSRDEKETYPLAAHCITRDVYMDDVISAADTKEEASLLQRQLILLMRAGGFNLRKWTSNEPELLKNLPVEYLASSSNRSCNFDEVSSLLGLKWDSTQDCFLFSIRSRSQEGMVTRRSVLREIAGLFDPLGLLAPVITLAKIFMQSLWLLNIDWDDPLPEQKANLWRQYYSGLSLLSSLRIPRWITVKRDDNSYELHGFADSSERAYAAVIYLRTGSKHAKTKPCVNLVVAKTRVAPLRQVSLPRLELCAATLLVRLIKCVKDILDLPNCKLHLWSDSSIVLCWLQQHPSKWKTFVANRVSEIQTSLPEATWRHIRLSENPADVASRGISGEKIELHKLWWEGPSFLSLPEPNLDSYLLSNMTTEQEVRATKLSNVIYSGISFLEEFVSRYSSMTKLCRVTAWCLRFIKRHRDSKNEQRNGQILSALELKIARLTLIRCLQEIDFEKERSLLSQSAIISRGPLARLNPFLDPYGLLRVGGRLKNALLDFHEKHPIILPKKGHLVNLLVREAHYNTLHGGVQLTLGTLRQNYWILCGRRAVRNHIHTCIKCWRWRAKTAQQQMADLPSSRVRPSRPFSNSGVDYAGPFHTKIAPGRAYRRFSSRRGKCSTITSDQGTNFIGADRELRRLFKAANFEQERLTCVLAQEGTTWRFNPPAAPHFGGIWEAAVKSMKFHLRRVIGDTALTFEEMSTVLAQIEACLNSRPLAPLGDDSDSFDILTPGHFLIGAALTAVPEPSLVEEQISRLTRWQLLQRLRDHFWKRWATEYLQHLQSRTKWTQPQPNAKSGDLCLVVAENTPPCSWPIARIVEAYPGDDNLVRVVKVRTPTTTLMRPITKICLFPAN